ncbi:hypothetical protein T492DRAFT_990000 [Pavlovales sp. CCMP2436]|nr:hypothetical protein T492DRAFT_990000 [Pavlovales sp. CCMP2436]
MRRSAGTLRTTAVSAAASPVALLEPSAAGWAALASPPGLSLSGSARSSLDDGTPLRTPLLAQLGVGDSGEGRLAQRIASSDAPPMPRLAPPPPPARTRALGGNSPDSAFGGEGEDGEPASAQAVAVTPPAQDAWVAGAGGFTVYTHADKPHRTAPRRAIAGLAAGEAAQQAAERAASRRLQF